MSYTELYDLTPRAFWNAVDGSWRQSENEEKKDWEKLRWQTCLLINVHLPKNKQISLQKLIQFEWEKNEKDFATYEETLHEYNKFLKKKNAKK